MTASIIKTYCADGQIYMQRIDPANFYVDPSDAGAEDKRSIHMRECNEFAWRVADDFLFGLAREKAGI